MISEDFIELCRRLSLPREWQAADAYAVAFNDHVFYLHENDTDPDDWLYAGRRFWLPREGDILDLLEAEGHAVMVGIRPAKDGSGYGVTTDEGDDSEYAFGPDRCTALLRLYEAVALQPLSTRSGGPEPKEEAK